MTVVSSPYGRALWARLHLQFTNNLHGVASLRGFVREDMSAVWWYEKCLGYQWDKKLPLKMTASQAPNIASPLTLSSNPLGSVVLNLSVN